MSRFLPFFSQTSLFDNVFAEQIVLWLVVLIIRETRKLLLFYRLFLLLLLSGGVGQFLILWKVAGGYPAWVYPLIVAETWTLEYYMKDTIITILKRLDKKKSVMVIFWGLALDVAMKVGEIYVNITVQVSDKFGMNSDEFQVHVPTIKDVVLKKPVVRIFPFRHNAPLPNTHPSPLHKTH